MGSVTQTTTTRRPISMPGTIPVLQNLAEFLLTDFVGCEFLRTIHQLVLCF